MTSTEHNDQAPSPSGGGGITIHNYDTGDRPNPDEPTWDTEALRRDYEVLGFQAPFVVVRRRADGALGSMEFAHSPRLYWGFSPEAGR